MATKPTLLERTDTTRTTSFDDKIEVDKPKEEVHQHVNSLLGALEGMINNNVKTAKDNATLTRALTVLEDRFTKLEKAVEVNTMENAKWHKYCDDALQEQGRDLDCLFSTISDLVVRIGKLCTTMESQMQMMLAEFTTATKIALEVRQRKR